MSTKRCLVPLYWVLLPVLLPVSPVLAQQQAVDFSPLAQVALAELKETNTPGAAVAVVSGDRLVFAKGFGTATISRPGLPLHLTRSFVVGSVTKMFTAAVLVTLAEAEQINLDEPIGKYSGD